MLFQFKRMFSYCPSKPRSPMLRVLVGLLGLCLLVLLLVFGLVIGLGMLLFAAARRLLRPGRPAPRAQEGVIEGEYTLVDKPGARLGLR
jgi:hypothetical protein